MKHLTYTTCLSLFLILFITTKSRAQQAGIDINRMNRDINIMENVLAEIFKVELQSPGNSSIHSLYGNLAYGVNTVRGTYLPGYGVIFTVSSLSYPVVTFGTQDPDSSNFYRFTYGSGGNSGDEVTEESVTSRIEEFLRDYGSTIGQLEEDDRVMVLFGINQAGETVPWQIFDSHGNGIPPNPVVSVVATKGDLDDYRAGGLTAQAFHNRISISSVTEPESQSLDIRVMANIFETGFSQRQEGGFRIRGSVDHLNLDNFGALFFFDVTYNSGFSTYPFTMDPDQLNVRVNDTGSEEGTEPDVDVEAEVETELNVEVERQLETARQALEQQLRVQATRREERNEEMRTAYDSLKTQLKEFLVDYGRTLNSVSSDNFIMVSVTPEPSNEALPERTDIQIQKSVLDALNRGALTRDRALGEVVLIDY